jgi:hypothetical protein
MTQVADAAVDFAHQRGLEALMSSVQLALDFDNRCDYGDQPGAEPTNRRAFAAHFSDLEPALGEWDDAVERVRAASDALWEWFAGEVRDRDLREPSYAVGALIDRLATLTVERSRRDELGIPYELRRQHFTDAVEGGECVSVYVESQKVAEVPGEAHAELVQNVEAVDRLIQALFDDAQSSEQAQEIGRASDALLDLKLPLQAALALQAEVTTMSFAHDCPLCHAPRGVRA